MVTKSPKSKSPKSKSPVGMSKLPTELLHLITENIPKMSDRSALSKSSKQMNSALMGQGAIKGRGGELNITRIDQVDKAIQNRVSKIRLSTQDANLGQYFASRMKDMTSVTHIVFNYWTSTQHVALSILPPNLVYLDASYINKLPKLPLTLQYLDISSTPEITIPTLPPKLLHLSLVECNIDRLPTLPSTLLYLNIEGNLVAELPKLPSKLVYLNVTDNVLEELPKLPSTLVELNASSNELSELPALPSKLEILHVANNGLSELPKLPHTIRQLCVGGNEELILDGCLNFQR